MGRASMTFRELRFIVEDELTHCYVFIEAHGDAPLGVQGWHHRTFPPSYAVVDIISKELSQAALWGLEAPPSPAR